MPDQNQIKVMAYDNSVHRFPKGTDPSVIDRVMKDYTLKKRGISTAKPTPQKPPEERFAGGAGLHSFGSGIARAMGFDPERLDKVQGKPFEEQWKEFSSQLIDRHFQGLKKGTLAAFKDPLNIGVGIDSVAKGLESSGAKLHQGLASGNRDAALQGAGELFAQIGQLLTAAEGRAALTKNASTVNGAVKAAAEATAKAGVDASEAARVAHRASSGWLGRMLHNRAVLDQYVDAKGLKVAQDVGKAAKEVEKEYGSHAENIEKQIDTRLPSGVIDATAEADRVKDILKDLVKTPQGLHPAIAQLLADAKKTGPGMWTFAKARQFRSSLGRALGRIEGPQLKAGWQIYDDLGKKLGAVAKKYGLGKEWEHYNTLSTQYHKYYGEMVDDVTEARAGEQVAAVLNKYKGQTNRLVQNLGKYGLKSDDITKFMKYAERWRKENLSVGRGSMFRMAYGSKGGIPVMIAARAAGAGWLPSVGAGALAGYLTTEMTNALRAAKLSPEVIEHILETTGLPGRMPKGKGTFSSEEPPEGGTPSAPTAPTKPKPSAPSPSAKFKGGISSAGVEASIKPATQDAKIQALKTEIQDLSKKLRGSASEADKALAKKRMEESQSLVDEMEGKQPKVTKVPEGEHGKGRLAEQAKARERIAKNRGEAKTTAQKEAAEAQARVEAQGLDVSKLQIPEMEEALRELHPVAWSAIQKARKTKAFPETDYEPYLREMLLRAYEAKSSGK
jgi:hypothetical protein